MRKITSLLMLLLFVLTGTTAAFAQSGENTVEYEAWPGWVRNNVASVYWVGFETPGTPDKSYKMSAFQYAQETGYGANRCYTAICTEAPDVSGLGTNGTGAILPGSSVLAVSSNAVEAVAQEYYTYNLEEEIELDGGTVYFMVFISSNEPNDEDMYTVCSNRVSLLTGAGTYAASLMAGNGGQQTGWIPGFKATLTMSDLDYALIRLGQIIAQIDFDAETYAMDVPGGYPEELVYLCEEAFLEAQDLNENADGATLEEVEAAIEKLQNAYETLLAARIPVPFDAGTYYLVNARIGTGSSYLDDASDLTDVDAAYSDGDNMLWGTEFDATIFGEDANPAYIWQIEEAGTDEGGKTLYTFKNFAFGQYLSNVTSASTAYGFVASVEDAAKFTVGTSDAVTGFVTFDNSGVTSQYTSLHAATSGQAVVNWLPTSDASAWTVVAIDDETLSLLDEKSQELRDQAAQRALNDTLTRYFALAAEAREAGRTFIFDGTDDGQFVEGDGLIIDASQLYSNAQDPAEGSYEGLLDTDYTTFFHTSWHASNPADEAHFLQIDLGQEVETLVLKYGVRSNAGSNDIPYVVTVYGTNDATLLSTPSTGSEEDGDFVPGDTVSSELWENLGQFTLTYQYSLKDAEGNDVTNSGRRTSDPVVMGAGVSVLELPAAYQYVRISVDQTVQSVVNGAARTNGDGFSYWNLGSLRAYEGEYDPDCVYAHMDDAAKAELEGSLAAAAAELREEAATQETIDRLKAAYEAFMAIYPDKSKLLAAIEEAQSYIATAIEGTEIGNYNAGATAFYQTVVDEAQDVADGVLTFSAYNEAMNELENAAVIFAANLVVPETGYYNIQSLTTGAAKDAFLVARTTSTTSNRANNGVAWNYANENPNDYVNALWYVEKTDNGSFTFKNVATGYYLDNTQTTLSGGIAQVAEPKEFYFRAARDTAGIGLNIIVNEEGTLFGNADPSAGFVVWNSGKGNDNSAWTFLPAYYEGTLTIKLDKPVSIHTLPFEVMAVDNAYSVAGVTEDGTAVALNAITGNIPAGTPFVIVADTAVTQTVQAFLTAFTAEDIVYTREALTVNGLVGTFEPDTINDKALVMNTESTELIYAAAPRYQVVAANSGYFVWSQLQELPTVATGDELLLLTEDLQTGISTLVVEPAAGRQGVYTLQGQKISDTRNLPAGVYIINGRKVLVK